MTIPRLTAIGLLLAFCMNVSCFAAEPVKLFNGRDLTGWSQRGGAATYSIENGEIVGRSVPNTSNTFLATEKEYGDFELELDFKIDDPKFNSGIQIRSHARSKGDGEQVYGYQVEIDPRPDRCWTAGIYFEAGNDHREAGWLNDLSKNEAARNAFKLGEWNHLKIIANGRHIQTWINGIPAADFTDDDDDAFTPSGFIGLQVHSVGDAKDPKEVRWRNITITDLANTKPENDESAEGDKKKISGLQLFGRAVAAMFGLNGKSGNDEAFAHLLGKPAPSFELKTIAGETVKLQDLRGKVVLLDFWASWCGPCMMAMPEIEKIHQEFAGQSVMVIGVNQRDDAEAAQEAVESKAITFIQILDTDGSVGDAFGVTGIPQTVLIDAEGRIQRIHQGYSGVMAQELTADIEKLLGGGSLVKAEVPISDAGTAAAAK
jgi:peroxiredoxin